ncbi:hypothetical protein [Curtobacterium flaccumfaciens]|uniref:hypothetical protein n=1 Tax=Curtobacterium flaccumfaciens TaxID=2035 RepID=UPI001E39EF5E|nr:hypothetical protein [Curtobacterium flaccumfaciens]
MTETTSAAIHRELFIWFAARHDVREVRYRDSVLVLAPTPRMKEDGSPWPTTVEVRIPNAELETAWPSLQRAATNLELGSMRDLPELAVFSLLDVHLDEAINSMREPGPNGYRYTGSTFAPA